MTSTLVTIPGYRLLEQIYNGSRIRVYRALCESNQSSVVIKLLDSEYPTFNELVQFRNQYSIAKNLNLTGIVKPIALLNYHNGYALVMEDFSGIPLIEEIKNLVETRFMASKFFAIAIQLSHILEGLYHNRVIHKDIKPQNILINPKTNQVKLIDFSISSLLPRESQEIQNPNVLEGTLAYMSPEQTGRMNRGIDYRTDFYSLGVTFYQLLTGQLPFIADEPMELVHCHIARKPASLIELVPTIPQAINDIVMKLMAKTPEKRYQSAIGLRYDLEICWQQWQEKSSISHFSPGKRDISDRFVIPEKLYGRETEVATLLAAFNRVAGREGEGENLQSLTASSQSKIPNPGHYLRSEVSSDSRAPKSKIELMLITGFSGIGKTAVVNEIHKPIVGARGYFIKGKFDQFKRDIPFSAWVDALQNLIGQLLAESSTSLAKWNASILKVLGENARVIIDVLPELELLIGKQPPVPQLEGNAAQNRFNRLFSKFIRGFATKEHPLVIFLDDLQWADSASLKLMQLLMSETDARYLLIIGAYRDNEVSAAHPLILTLDEIRKTEARVNQITLAPLNKPSLNRLIADTLSCLPEKAVPLTELVFTKTKGNPFFSNQFLKAIHENGLISFDAWAKHSRQSFIDNQQDNNANTSPGQDYWQQDITNPNPGDNNANALLGQGYWQCDIAQIRTLAISDDIVEFMASQLQKLPENTQTVLKLAACIGNSFDLATLAIVNEKSQAETAADLWKALQEGLVVPISDVYKLFQNEEEQGRNFPIPFGYASFLGGNLREPASPNPQSPTYKFLHDRVQQAAYYLIPSDWKQSTHLKIGRLLLSNIPEAEREEKIFDIVNPLNIGVELISSQTEREELAKLNLIAGRKALASTAYTTAKRYLTVGLQLLTAKAWHNQYDLTLALHESAVQAAFLSGDFEQMEQLTSVVLQQAVTLLDTVKVYEVKIQACMAQGKMLEAIHTTLPVLKLLGVEFPEQPSQSDIQQGLEETASSLSSDAIANLIHLPEMTDSQKLAAMQLLSRLFAAAFIAVPELMLLIVLKQVNLSIQYGNASMSAYAYVSYGLILCGVVGDIESGYQFGQLALSVLERFNAKELNAKLFAVFSGTIKHWKEHTRETFKFLQDAYHNGLETGDLEFTGHAAYLYCFHSYFVGKQLAALEPQMATYAEALRQLKQETSLNYHKIYWQSALNLMGRAENPCRLIGEAYDEKTSFSLHKSANDRYAICALSVNKLKLCYLFSDYGNAMENAVVAEEYLDGATATLLVPLFHFYDSLARLAVYLDTPSSEQKHLLSKVFANQKKMKQWADCAPMNYLHKFYLVEAERYRVFHQNVEAMDYYDKAIALAKENEYLNEEALALELTAKFYLTWGKERIARTYLTDAYYAYARWGAKAKVEDLEKRYSQLLVPILNREMNLTRGETIAQMTVGTVSSVGTGISAVLDWATVMKASQALSGEIYLDRLLSTLMQVAIENAGASKCCLILQRSDNLVIEAIRNSRSAETSVLQSIPVETSNELPKSIINYVARTQEPVIINDLNNEIQYLNDPYIIQQQPKSILCTPIQNQGKAIGILYLENHLTPGAFTSDRLEVLKVLSSQAAISIENARLYTSLEDYNRNLEAKVTERTQELSQTLEQLQTTQEELIQSEKMAALGQLVAGVAHEINTPLGAIRSSIEYIADFFTKDLEQFTTFFQNFSQERQRNFLILLSKSGQPTNSLTSKEKRLLRRELKRQLDREAFDDTDSLASTLVDIGVYGNIQSLLPLLKDPDSETILKTVYNWASARQSTETIATATERAAKVVFALKNYARYDHSGEKVQANIIEGIETVLTLYHNQIKHQVKVIKNYEKIPAIWCYVDELNQVWTNLVHNALQAMDYKGTIKIDAIAQPENLLVSITDSGKGIPSEIMPKIFQPFFTTKPAGEGSGLGLDIVKKIVEKHQGKIEVESKPGQTTFTVSLPIQLNHK